MAAKVQQNAKAFEAEGVNPSDAVVGLNVFADIIETKGVPQKYITKAYAKRSGITLPKKSGRKSADAKSVALTL